VTGLSAEFAAADPAETRNAVGNDASWLFIQTADALRFDGKAITLTGIDPAVVMFTDRPHRAAESIALATFVEAWSSGGDKTFRADPPNAGLTTLVDGKFQLATVELTEPRLDGTTLTYGVRVLEGTLPQAGGETSLFIDGCNWGDTSGC
jgi:hypothetical protein